MALAGFACADTISVNHPKENIETISSDTHNPSSNNNADDCTILCSCDCCHVCFTPTASIQLSLPIILPQLYIPYLQHFKDIEMADFLIPPIS